MHAYHGVRDPNEYNNNVSWEPDLTNCDAAYPSSAFRCRPPDLNCADIAPFTNIRVIDSAANLARTASTQTMTASAASPSDLG